MRHLLVWAAVAQLCALATPPGALAHIPLYGVGTQTRFVFKEDRVLVTFDLSYDSVWAQGEMVRADKDRSSSVDEAEADAYLKSQWEERIASRIAAFMDGKKAELSKVAERHESLVGEIFPTPFSLFYELEVAIPAGEGRPLATHTFDFEDNAVAGETKALPRFVVPYQGHGRTEGVRFLPEFLAPQPVGLDTDGYWLEGRKLSLRFSFEGGGAAGETAGGADPGGDGPAAPQGSPGGAEKAATPAPEPPAPVPDRAESLVDETDWIHRAFRDFGTSGWAALVWILVATLYGAGHALTPGHGKTMVAAYLIGTKGTIRDAAILGIATTVTHTGSVFIFGGSIFLILNATTRFSEGHVRNMIIVGTQLVSGLLLLALGITLFVRRMRGLGEPTHHHGHHHHHHEHHHDHHHHHHHHGHAHHDPDHHHGHDHHQDGHHHHHGQAHAHAHPHEHAHGTAGGPEHGHHQAKPGHSPEEEHAHGHEHGHAHGHHHAHGPPPGLFQGGAPHLRELLALGFSGGLVPCPAGLVAILLGLQAPEKLLFALGLLVFFSIGLGSVLVAIGVFLVTGKMLVSGAGPHGGLLRRAVRVLPVFSSLFIAALGAFFIVRTFTRGRTEIGAMFRLMADWLQ